MQRDYIRLSRVLSQDGLDMSGKCVYQELGGDSRGRAAGILAVYTRQCFCLGLNSPYKCGPFVF